MITSFRHKGLRRFFDDDDGSKLSPQMLDRIRTVLSLLDAAESVDDLYQPSLRLHQLKGDLSGFWAVTVRANWRIIFRFEGDEASDVDFVDHH